MLRIPNKKTFLTILSDFFLRFVTFWGVGGGVPLSLTSVPEPGRKVLMVMVFPGAGNWASMMALMKGWTKAGDRALRLSTSSST